MAEASRRSAADLVAALQAARESWCDLGDGRRLRVRRPAEHALADLRRGGALAYCDAVVGWQGFTEADVLPELAGALPGAAAALPCEPELVRELLGDRAEWLGALIEHLRSQVVAHAEAAEARRKN